MARNRFARPLLLIPPLIAAFALAACSKGVSQTEYHTLQTQVATVQQQATSARSQVANAQATVSAVQDERTKAQSDLADAKAALQHSVFHVAVGSESQDGGTELDSFFPADVTIDQGDTVVFTLHSNEIHTVSFNAPDPIPDVTIMTSDGKPEINPVVAYASPPAATPPPAPGTPSDAKVDFNGQGFVSSGLMETVGDTYEVTFTKAGTYQYICLVHGKSMSGKIVVQASGATLPMTPVQVDQQAAQQISAAGLKALDAFNAVSVPAPVATADGHSRYTVYAGVGDMADAVDFMHFFGAEHLTVHVGDTVRFDISKNTPGTPHTVTFLSGADDPPFVVPQNQEGGPPLSLINPDILASSPLPPTPYMGTGIYNSGLLLAGVPNQPQTWDITFGKAGTYPFDCVIHDAMGMQGTITVVP